MSARSLMLAGAAVCMSLLLAACQGRQAEVAAEGDAATGSDPAVNGALGTPIMVDRDLAGQSNANAATSGARPVDGGVPTVQGGGTVTEATGDARRIAGGNLMRAPDAVAWADTCDSNCDATRPATLGGLARQQGGEACAADIQYGAGWAQRLPAAFPVYPRAELVEAAGVMNGRCNVRVVNFRSRAGMQAVLDFYYTQARRAGYDAEHVVRGEDHLLGGTRGDLAYVVMLRPMAGGLVDVDLIASGGR